MSGISETESYVVPTEPSTDKEAYHFSIITKWLCNDGFDMTNRNSTRSLFNLFSTIADELALGHSTERDFSITIKAEK